jgi:DnaJ-class molecular chaperone
LEIFYRKCPDCKGKGRRRIDKGWLVCKTCEGKGNILTKLGKHLIDTLSIFMSKR